VIADTSGLLALFNLTEPAHTPVQRVVARTAEPLVVSRYVVAELDYLDATRIGLDAELAMLAELAAAPTTWPASTPPI
jgi:predicted nucleic acid-binding protein